MIYRPISALLLLCSPLLAQAQPGQNGAEDNTDRLDRVVVTATRTPQPVTETLAPTSVITRADIERTQARSVRELLRRVPGISVANQGGRGKLTSMFVRGTESDHVLVLVNGVRYGDATSGIPAIQDLPVDQIKRIEIVRGPRSALYGSDAIGGVIQIFTRDGEDGFSPHASIGAGRYDTYEATAGVAGGGTRGSYHIGLSATDSEGFNACQPAAGAGCFNAQPDPDDDGYERVSGNLRASYQFDSGLRVSGHALRNDGDTEFDGGMFSGNQSDTLRQVMGLSLAGRLRPAWRMELSLGRTRDESEDFFDGSLVSEFKTERDTATFQNDISLGDGGLLTVGADYRRVEVDSTTAYTETRRDNAGVFVQYLGRFGDHHLQLAGRGDDNEQFGEQATGSITWGWDLTATHTITVSHGTAFKAPTFNELYFPGFSNPNLTPEESRTTELGLINRPDWGRWSLHAFETRVDDLITLDAAFVPQNISETRLRGVEAEADARLGKWLVHSSATWLDAENRSDGANAGNELPRRPTYTAQLDIDREFGRVSAGASLFVASSRYDDLANSRRLGGYQLVDLRSSLRISQIWRLQARLSNIFDEDYATASFFNQPGRALFVSLHYEP